MSAIIAVAFILYFPAMSDAASQVPLIEIDKRGLAAPAGYRWYIVRDWKHVYSGKASGVALGEKVHAMFGRDHLVFTQNVGDTLSRRRPKRAGEVSRVLLPSSFQLPPDLAAITVEASPSALPPRENFDTSSFGFHEEQLPAGAPAGYKAYTFVHPQLVFSGIATGIEGQGRSFTLHGKGLDVRRAEFQNEPSHILLPSHVALPSAVTRRTGRPNQAKTRLCAPF